MDNYIVVELDDTTALLAEQHTRVDRVGSCGEPKVSIFYKKVASFNSVSTAVEFINAARTKGEVT